MTFVLLGEQGGKIKETLEKFTFLGLLWEFFAFRNLQLPSFLSRRLNIFFHLSKKEHLTPSHDLLIQ